MSMSQRKSRHGRRTLLLPVGLLALTLAGPAAADDPFLEPQVLPPEIPALTLNDSQTGESFVIRLDENRLPVNEDFFGEQANIPFSIVGTIFDSPSGSRLHAFTTTDRSSGGSGSRSGWSMPIMHRSTAVLRVHRV